MKKILVVGLGLIGGSLAMALQGFEDFEVVGAVRSQATFDKAAARHAADRLTFDPAGELPEADVVVLCQDPAGIIAFLDEHRDRFKPGCLIWDVCGVKTAVMEAAKRLPQGVDFIGCHPMAGKEVSGIDNAEGTLFRNTHFIVTPGPGATQEHLDLLRRMADWCRFGDVTVTTPEHHDQMIAYTSQLMHVIAVSVCDNDELFSCMGFEGGSFRDCTRVAALDPAMWTQLFTLNAPALSGIVAQLEQRIRQYRLAIEAGDQEALRAMLAHASGRKKQINLERARGDDVRPAF
ncbi:MAG: prephenate dehydrogenase/arogenate dehydrogenase family protein [Oscillospiraceae bacterium]|nr:prephenate dehydrogenase/arogenate dehydrogenase family protein [Oscillospiraceae bacterium]